MFACIESHPHIFLIFFPQFKGALETAQKTFPSDTITGVDRDFLQSIFISAPPDEESVDFSQFSDEKVQGYAFVLKIMAGENSF